MHGRPILDGIGIGGGPVGSRALGVLRIEKGYGSWGREYSPEYWPQEVGLDRLVKGDKGFLHKDAWLKIKETRHLSRKSRGVAQAVAEWREQRAQDDRSRRSGQ